jgi:Nif-specific ferredoxin III
MSALTRDGRAWEPSYLVHIDPAKCVGCGRCFKVCARGVMALKGVNEEGQLVDLDDDDEVERKVMSVAQGGNCIGCGACGRVCAKGCQAYGGAG